MRPPTWFQKRPLPEWRRNGSELHWRSKKLCDPGKDLTVDSTFDFEQRRNTPVRYDRTLVQRTVQAMRRIDEIRQRRRAVHHRNRMLQAMHDQHQEEQVEKQMSKHRHLLKQMDDIENKRTLTLREKAIKYQRDDAQDVLSDERLEEETEEVLEDELNEDDMEVEGQHQRTRSREKSKAILQKL